MSEFTFEIRTALGADPDDVWAHASSMSGANYELWPWVQMTSPREAKGLDLSHAHVGRELFASVLLLGGIFPFDHHHITLERVLDRGFDEESWSWMQRRWRHERRVEATEGGCLVVDRLTVVPRFAPTALVRPIVAWLFEKRHARLRRRFDGGGEGGLGRHQMRSAEGD